ncbi:transcriptional repressor LexA [Oceanispirochaeta sp.]|jgi:repressor LexA|uniref:transcriptional repressor LexA n=1 Tax=Oceanispirochaeta sp. TaxID=2035350 RepID=UPI00262CB16D|nr:transcriptional repressor LexA [Oceanispirochaeta sp.]MDA3957177.1 transcriptional repressor LexA [Oceanispirochaeta sp.]
MKTLTKRQGEILDFIRGYIQDNQYPPSIREVGRNFSISVKGAYDHVKALEKKEVIAISHNKSRAITLTPDIEESEESRKIPILGSVAAGLPLFAEENHDGSVTLPIDVLKQGNLFALRVQGESMTGAGILDGDLAVFVQQPLADNGEIVVAMVDDSVTLKRFYKEKNRVRLQAENPAYPSIFTQDVRILGKLITIIRQYG